MGDQFDSGVLFAAPCSPRNAFRDLSRSRTYGPFHVTRAAQASSRKRPVQAVR